MTVPDNVLATIETCYDALPRSGAQVESHGPLTLFVRSDPASFPYYARPTLGQPDPVTQADVAAVRSRQRALGAPETFEWVHDLCPSLTDAAAAEGLVVHRHPLMVLAGPLTVDAPAGVTVRLLTADDADLMLADAVAHVGFGAPGTSTGDAGPAERDEAAAAAGPARAESLRRRLAAGTQGMAAAFDARNGPLSVGSYQSAAGAGEIVGVATLPRARRRGLGAAVTAALVGDLRSRGVATVFLSASDDDVARMYARVGFRRVGTAGIAEPAGT